jgi:hypothetical protein
MSLRKVIRRIAVALGATALVAVPAAVTTSTPASASTIPYGHLQLCAQGNYRAVVHVLPVYLPGGDYLGGFESTIQWPGQCWIESVDTRGQWAQVDVVGLRKDGSRFYIGSRWYNSSVSGMGLGAEGTQWNPYIWTW